MGRKVSIGTYPCRDDAVAAPLALDPPDGVDLPNAVAGAGKLPFWRIERNARCVTASADRWDVPSCAGREGPLRHPLATAAHVDGVAYTVDAVRTLEAGSTTLCCLGPLTNASLAFLKAPSIAAASPASA